MENEENEKLKNQYATVWYELSKIRTEMYGLVVNMDNLYLVNASVDQLNEQCVRYIKYVEAYTEPVTDEPLKDNVLAQFHANMTSILNFRNQINEWIYQAERRQQNARYTETHNQIPDQPSQTSLVEPKVQPTESTTELQMFDRRQHLQEVQQQMKPEMDIVKPQATYEKLNGYEHESSSKPEEPAMEKATGRDDITDERSRIEHNETDTVTAMHKQESQTVSIQTVGIKNNESQKRDNYHTEHDKMSSNVSIEEKLPFDQPHCENFVTINAPQCTDNIEHKRQRNTVDDITTRMLEMQRIMISALLLPRPEVPTYRGDLLQYSTFIQAFELRVAQHVDSDADKLYYLLQHLEGDPEELVSGCLFMAPNEGYQKARELLKKEYGDPFKISMAYMNRVSSWPNITDCDSKRMKELSIYLTKCYYAMQSISHMDDLNNVPYMQCIVKKLPEELQERWREKVYELKQNGIVASFKDIVEFVDDWSDTLNDPVYGFDAMIVARTELSNPTPMSSFVTEAHLTSQCIFCHKAHSLNDCELFNKQNNQEKTEFVKINRLCFGCLGKNHLSRNCPHKSICKHCGKPHPTALHINDFTLKHGIGS